MNVLNHSIHSAHCRACKERVREILTAIYGECRVNPSIPVAGASGRLREQRHWQFFGIDPQRARRLARPSRLYQKPASAALRLLCFSSAFYLRIRREPTLLSGSSDHTATLSRRHCQWVFHYRVGKISVVKSMRWTIGPSIATSGAPGMTRCAIWCRLFMDLNRLSGSMPVSVNGARSMRQMRGIHSVNYSTANVLRDFG